MIDGAVTQKTADGSLESWVKAQAYIPLGIMLETAALLGLDSCPMEGFSPEKFDEILNLKEKNLKSAAILAVGYRGDDATSTRPKVRRTYDEVVEVI
jgi:nitroreductase